ncbi:DUF6090 family protein [Algoriphagus formosus]|uniref:Uncharacterized protein n=1 Tax=Algoriphagus formosus TaxID=2007308 RepID=A0A4R5VF92_9BACT|nr:DUF6090 family protein [Algoriphagus aquimaris]TDK50931.1 hypothetical protein E1898_00395 [Algoriphagus aquimaris]
MISLFRKIRQKLLSQNRVTRYLVYAVGEILLVVIGILIALGVNNFNESQLEDNREKQVVMALHNEFEENLTSLKFEIDRIKVMIETQEVLLSLFGSKNLPADEILDSMISNSFINMTWNPSSYVLNDLKNSGQISKLTDSHLQSLLFRWERHYENVNEFTEDDLRSSSDFLNFIKQSGSLRNADAPYLTQKGKKYSKSKFNFSNSELLKNIRFENVVDDKYVTSILLLQQYEETVGIIEEILIATAY